VLLKTPFQPLQSFLLLPQRLIDDPRANAENERRHRVKLLGAPDLSDGLLPTPHRVQVLGVPVVSDDIAWFEFNRTLQFTFRLRPVPIPLKQDKSKSRVRFRKRAVKLYLLQDCRLGFREGDSRRRSTVEGEVAVAFRKPRTRQGGIGILFERLLKKLKALIECRESSLEKIITAS
jgi:hypothetical protein